MKPFDPNRVHVEFRDRISATQPILDRKYTMTHSDDTAQLYVTIGKRFAQDKFSSIRDEVLLGFEPYGQQIQLFGSVIVDTGDPNQNSELRNRIFLEEMPLALKAIRYADRELYDGNSQLDEVPIVIWFQSMNDKYNKLYKFGSMKEYR